MNSFLTTCLLLILLYVTYYFWHDVLDFQWASLPLAIFSTWALTAGANSNGRP